ncbi:MAG TPA: hypothetical protein VFE90_17955 [Myxococcales bacterium]|nr:hypothetical protein [Myxococcales bacterium]
MKKIIATVLVGVLAGCGGSNLSLSVKAGSAAAVASSGAALTAGTGIVLTRVRVVIRKLELEKAAAAASADAGTAATEADETDEIASGPYLLDLSGTTLDGGGVAKLLDATFAPGNYREIKFEVHKPQSGETAANASLQDMIDAQASIIADGTIDGAAFSFKTSVTAEQELEGNLALADGSNLTVNVDASSWFTASGGRLDPRNEANRSQIENNIQKSFKAFKDDDHDGHEDR